MNAATRLLSRIVLGSIAFASLALACSVSEPVSNIKLVRDADTIIRAVATNYAKPPVAGFSSTGLSDSLIRFKTLETLRGGEPSEISIAGYLVDSDEFNDHAAPDKIRSARRAQRKLLREFVPQGPEFLLFLQKGPDGSLTVYWYALAPVNEQLHSDQDPWLLWVRKMAKQEAPQRP